MDEEKQERDDTPPREGEFRGAERNGHRRENDVVVDFFLEHFWKRNPTLIDKNDKNDKNEIHERKTKERREEGNKKREERFVTRKRRRSRTSTNK